MFSDFRLSSTRKQNSSHIYTPKPSTTAIPEYPSSRAAQDAQWKLVRQVSPLSSNVNEPTFSRLERSQVDGGGYHPRGTLIPALSAQWRIDRGHQQPDVSLMAQRRLESAYETHAPLPFPDGEEHFVKSHHEWEREKERQSGLPTSTAMGAPEESEKLKHLPQTQRQNVRRERTKWERSQTPFEAAKPRGELLAVRGTHKQVDKSKKDWQERSVSKEEYDQLQTLLQNRTAELRGAQIYLTTADAFSENDVASTLKRINAEVLQRTLFMTEFMTKLFSHKMAMQVAETDEQSAAYERVSGAIGDTIAHLLRTKKHKDDYILIQIAFQACLTLHLRRIICAWVVGADEKHEHNRFINKIYQSMREKESQAVAGRWRALTRAHIRSTLNEEQIVLQITNRMILDLSDILLIAGCNVPKSEVASALYSGFFDRLSFIASLAMDVNKITGEDVTSGDFEVTAVPPATPFDETEMEDSFDSGRPATARGNYIPRVLCTTDLGLRKVTQVGMTGENQWRRSVLLKPKVALESVVDMLDE